MEAGTPPFDHGDERWRSVPARLRAEIVARRRSSPPRGPCFWLDLAARRCRHYEHRPDVCRDFKLGGDGCLWSRKEHLQERP
jgi:Fe-S-cluster containining protein